MDQKSYLAQALWHYRSIDKFTDLTIVCKEGALPAHTALLAPFFASLGLEFSSTDDVPEFLLLPDLAQRDVEGGLKNIYGGHKATVLFELLKSTKDFAKLEIDNEDESEPFENGKVDNKENLSNDVTAVQDEEFRQRDEEAKDLIDITKKEVKEDNPDSEIKEFYHKTKIDVDNRLNMHPEECLAPGIKSISDTKQCAHCETKLRTNEKLKSHIYNVHKDKRATSPRKAP